MSSQNPLSVIQTAIIARAAQRPDRAVFPLVLDARLVGGARTKVLTALLTRELVEEVATDLVETAWRKSEPGHYVTLRLTDAGMIAAGVTAAPPAAESDATAATAVLASPPKPPSGKLGLVLAALGTDNGASIDTLTSLTGWLPHTTRAALTRLRQRGFPITRHVEDGRTSYRLASQATAADHAA